MLNMNAYKSWVDAGGCERRLVEFNKHKRLHAASQLIPDSELK